jgi:hypothetical protein
MMLRVYILKADGIGGSDKLFVAFELYCDDGGLEEIADIGSGMRMFCQSQTEYQIGELSVREHERQKT